MKKFLIVLTVLLLFTMIGCSNNSNVDVPDTLNAEDHTLLPPEYEVAWPVVSVEAEDFGMENSLENTAFAEVFENTADAPLDKLIAFYLIADGLSEDSHDEIYRRFMEAPNTVLTYLALMGNQTVELTGLGEVSAAEFTCQGIASADVAWYGATPEFDAIIEEYRGYYQAGRIAELLDCLKSEHEAAIQRYTPN